MVWSTKMFTFVLTSNYSVCFAYTYRSVYLHWVYICEAGSNLHPVFVYPQQIFFHNVHRQTSAG